MAREAPMYGSIVSIEKVKRTYSRQDEVTRPSSETTVAGSELESEVLPCAVAVVAGDV